jgi:hypothetical protein
MAHLDVKPLYSLQLTAEEFKLIGLALAGKLDGKECTAARELNLKLQQMREAQQKNIYDASVAALSSAKEAATD